MDLLIDFSMVLNDLFDGVYVVDLDRTIHYWNHGAERLTGYKSEEVIGRSCRDNILVHVSEAGEMLCKKGCPLMATMDDGQPREATVFMSHKDGHRLPIVVRAAPLRDTQGKIIGAVEIFNDNTREWRTREKIRELEKMAMVDTLTELPNRRYLDTQLESRYSEFRRYGWRFGVIYLDIDHFKNINDTYGHEFGDKALKVIAKSMIHNTRPHDVVGRWGGEEFLAVIPNVAPQILGRIGERYRFIVENSYLEHEGEHVGLSISGGTAIIGQEETIEEVLKKADDRLYQAKESGRNRIISA